eukprot:TRINITY_DN2361_c0_g1_i6.p1 TRINITY_DN2361_c0_g1~~TRINITY_DN2361_c0_g1_i6.p1  ORF type:complete len:328 (-),score=83.83 TRINITY_DN2361_c0_g1_i6:79-1062(-)
MMVLGYLLISVSCLLSSTTVYSFFISLGASCIHGLTSCFGESVILGYLKGFPADLVVGWSSGTGFAGVVGAGLVVLLTALDFELFAIYLVALGLVLFYLLSFIYLNRQKNKFARIEKENSVLESVESEQKEEIQSAEQVDEAKENVKMGFSAFCHVFGKIWYLCGSLAFVYYFEYSIFTSFTDRTIKKLGYDHRPGFIYKNLFEILLLAYQCGVLISRSSLKLIKIPEVWVFFVLQLSSYIFWLMEVILVYNGIVMVKNPYIMIILLFYVGLCGGGSYVNVMYCIISHDKLKFYEKELALNICTILNDTGVICASITALIMSNWVYP